jgi:hypothetical protein
MSQFPEFERPRYFLGKVLGADDLNAEQDYFRGKTRLHNRFLHGWGIVAGLEVRLEGDAGVVVAPGFALDCAGNELVLPAPETLPLAGLTGRHYLTLEYTEIPTAPTPTEGGEPEFTRVREAARVGLASVHPGLGHHRLRPGSPGCGLCHALCLATLTHDGTRWRLVPQKRHRGT